MNLRYIDVCSGISAPTAAWKPLRWQALCFAEIEAAPRAVLAHHYPDVPLNGDFTNIKGTEYGPVDLLVGGTPCQSFSVAGLRGGLADERGNLALEYLRLADRARPRWLVWENVPGVLSSGGGRDFGTFLGGLAQLGYGFAYTILDAQHFGVPQRRRRVFVVGYLGDWRRAAAVLFERHSLQGHPAPRRETGQGVTGCLSPGAHPGGFNGQDAYTGHLITHSLRAEGFDASEDGTGRGTPIIPIDMRQASRGATMTNNRAEGSSGGAPGTGIGEAGGPSFTVAASHTPAVAFMENQRGELRVGDCADSLKVGGGKPGQGYAAALTGSAVRRLTPRECERLQGFPDDFTLVPHRGKPMADGPRYKMLGNSMAVPVVRWIGERIAVVEALSAEGRLAA
jgi:DNA (cytosine-5)-methyltransferase 1